MSTFFILDLFAAVLYCVGISLVGGSPGMYNELIIINFFKKDVSSSPFLFVCLFVILQKSLLFPDL